MPYKVEIDNISRDEWEYYAKDFSDYSIYQTWPYQQVRAEIDGQEVTRAIVKDDSEKAVLMTHVRIKRVPLLGLRIGYVQWGPLVCERSEEVRCSKEALGAFREIYLKKKVDVLRLVPNVREGELGQRFSEMLKSCGFNRVKYVPSYRTFSLWVGDSEEGIRKRLRKSFRRDLRYGEKAGAEIQEGEGAEFCEIMERLYRTAKERKGFKGVDPQQFLRVQPMLFPSEKMKFIVAYHDKEPIAVHLASNLGETSVVLIVACHEKALSCFASYVLWYQGAVSACAGGMKWCDLGGIDPDTNPNVYQFKSRMGPKDIHHIGTFEAYANTYAKMMWYVPARVHNLTRSC